MNCDIMSFFKRTKNITASYYLERKTAEGLNVVAEVQRLNHYTVSRLEVILATWELFYYQLFYPFTGQQGG